MKIFIIGGPGHHFNHVKSALNGLGISYSHSNYWPTFQWSNWNKKEESSVYFNLFSKIIHMLHYHFFKYVWKYNRQDEEVLNIYSSLVASKINLADYNLVWGFQMTASDVFKSRKSDGVIKLLDYPTIYIEEYMNIMEREYAAYQYHGYKNSYFSSRFIKKMKDECQLADKILVLSSYAKDTMIKGGVDPKKLFMLPLSVDSDFYLPSSEVNKMDEPLKILFVGRIEYLKGVHYLLKAFHELTIDATLTLVGHASEETKSIITPYRSDMRITLLSGKSKQDLLALYQSHDVLVLPSIQESFGLVLLEAMSCGMAVVASRHSGGPDIIEAGKDGLLVDPYRSDQIADGLYALANNRGLLNQIKKNARNKIQSHYSIAQYEKRVADLLSSLNH